ncbi:unnamed protein product, partial [Medioppia subpectinata]
MPELLRRYPPEDHSDFALPPDVVFFCQPEGCVSASYRRTSQRDTNSFVFALTEKDTSRVRYGICVNFYRTVARRSAPAAAEERKCHKCLSLVSFCIISHHPFFSSFRECLQVLKRMVLAFQHSNLDRRHKRDPIWQLLTTRVTPGDASFAPQVILDFREVETWCLKLLSCPVPVPGKTKLELEVVSREMRA